jgi:hypothetical protein
VLASLAWVGAGARPLPAQGPGPLVLAGRAVLVRGRDTTVLRGVEIVAHRIGLREQGPVDSLRSDAAGRFRFRVMRPDTGAMYVVSTRYAGIGYFSTPFSTKDRAGTDTIRLAVYDTSATGSPLAVAVRHLVISRADKDGSRDVLDIVQVANPGVTTRVPGDSADATWQMRLPRAVQSFHVGEGEVPSSAVRQAGDTVLVHAPFPPGEKQVVVTYVVPRGVATLRVPIDQATARLELLVEDSNVTASGAALVAANPIRLESRTFRRFSASKVPAGQTVEIVFGGGTGAGNLGWLAVVLSAVLLGVGGWAAARRKGIVAPAGGAAADAVPERDALVRQIVALDERYAGREAEAPPAEWAAYQAKRAALKAQLAGRLAQR